jgi:hypothetical protein
MALWTRKRYARYASHARYKRNGGRVQLDSRKASQDKPSRASLMRPFLATETRTKPLKITACGVTIDLDFVEVGPSLAKEWLKQRGPNRPISKDNLRKIGDAMLALGFVVNGSTVVWDLLGFLIDGQHRLIEIIEKNVVLPIVTVRDVPVDAWKVIDVGKGRSAGDVLATHGVRNAHNVAASLKFLRSYESGVLDYRPENKGFKMIHSNDVVFAMWVKNPGILHYVRMAMRFCRQYEKTTPSSVGVFLYLVRENPVLTDFYDHLVNGTLTKKGDPRQAMIRYFMHPRYRDLHGDYQPRACFIAFTLVWNHFLIGATLKSGLHVDALGALPAIHNQVPAVPHAHRKVRPPASVKSAIITPDLGL